MNWLTYRTRYETEGLKFFATKKEHSKGPNNIIDLWREYNIGECYSLISITTNMPPTLEKSEEADSHKMLLFNDEQYPQLPDDVTKLRLEKRRAILRQFVAAVRRKVQWKLAWFCLLIFI